MHYIVFLFTTLLLMLPVWINNFALAYYDTAFYLNYAQLSALNEVLIFRPLVYSGFLKISQSVFVVTALQCLWLNLLLFKNYKLMNWPVRLYPLVMIFSMILTPVALYANMLLPDIFAAFQFLSFLGLLQNKLNRFWKYFFSFSFLLSSVMHYSNLNLTIVLLLALLIFKLRKRMIWILLAPVILLPFLHGSIWQKWTLSNSEYFFLFSRLTAFDISQEYMLEKCPTIPYKLCIVIHEGFDPWDWSPSSVIGRFGGLSAIQDEMRTISIETLKKPELLGLFVFKSLQNAVKQFFMFSRPIENTLTHAPLENSLQSYNSTDANFYLMQNSRQWGEAFNSQLVNGLEKIYLVSAICILFLYIFYYKKINLDEKKLLKTLLIFLVLNAFICGVLTEPSDRYQGRLFILLPIFCLSIIFKNLFLTLRKHRI